MAPLHLIPIMPLEIHNLFDARVGNHEEINPLIKNEAFTLEHIVSNGQSSEQDFWYDQSNDEWVVLITGTATLIGNSIVPI